MSHLAKFKEVGSAGRQTHLHEVGEDLGDAGTQRVACDNNARNIAI